MYWLLPLYMALGKLAYEMGVDVDRLVPADPKPVPVFCTYQHETFILAPSGVTKLETP